MFFILHFILQIAPVLRKITPHKSTAECLFLSFHLSPPLACHQHTQLPALINPFFSSVLIPALSSSSSASISSPTPALILILPKEAHFVQQRGYLEPVLTLDSTLDKYPQLRNHKTNGRPGLAVFWQASLAGLA